MALRLGIGLLFAHLDFGINTAESSHTQLCLRRTKASGYFLQNMLGCFLIAVVARHKPLLNEHIAAGLSTGLCGSLTTWATWMEMEAFTALGGEVWMAVVGVVCMLSVSLASYSAGEIAADCGMGVRPSVPVLRPGHKEAASSGEESGTSGSEGTSSGEDEGAAREGPAGWAPEDVHGTAVPAPKPRRAGGQVHALIVGSALLVVVVTFALLIAYEEHTGLLYMAMSPFGAVLRWLLSLGNAYTAPLPVFTLVANTLGCGVDAVSAVMADRIHGGLGHELWSGFGTGFGGSLSTVSTFVAELRNDKLGGFRMRAAYFLISLALAMAVLLPTYAYAKC